MEYNEKHKPVIETVINTSALALTAFGVTIITANGDWNNICKGCMLILYGAGLEWFKYFGRLKKLW